ncbi:DUF1800 domain-containing protein [Microscilla marina]|uniref:Probable signal peptide protein, putative n=1 Tax=Microscilla marina ATCC 23134 TaxID=313606 RepID=A1ZQI1_MICM2|nr:DUF1800 family protein [Microscilla marina]EAY27353.1 probable signal peptide protein, putative [Microscilla marina ATCC 23134]
MSLEKYTGTWSTQTAAHLLRRASVFPTRQEVKTYLDLGSVDAAVDQLLGQMGQSTPTHPAPPLDPSGNDMGLDQVYTVDQDSPPPTSNDKRREYVISWWVRRMLDPNIQQTVIEKITLWLHVHFTTIISNNGMAFPFLYHQNKLYRSCAFGQYNLKEFSVRMSKDAAMLLFLDGGLNTKTRVNENFGRELLELYTIGKGPQIAEGDYTTYTEDDVITAARVLTGFRHTYLEPTERGALPPFTEFRDGVHDTNNKTFSDKFNNQTITGRSGADGINELDDMIDMIFSQSATATYLCRSLYRFFVYPKISESVEQNIIPQMASVMTANNFALKPVLDNLLKSAHFYEVASSVGAIIKSPVDFIIGTVRHFGQNLGAANTFENYSFINKLRRYCEEIQQKLYDPPEVAGWKAYHQSPIYHEDWITTLTLPLRFCYSDELSKGVSVQIFDNTNTETGTQTLKLDAVTYIQNGVTNGNITNVTNAATLVQELCDYLFPVKLSSEQLTALSSALGSDWGTVWQNDQATAATRLETMLVTLFRLEEYHLY